jgi:integrase
MGASDPQKSTASNKDESLEGVRAELLSAYLVGLDGRPVAARSRQAYSHQVRRYLVWLRDRSPVDGDPLGDGDARDRAIVVTLLYTGLRLAELGALDVEDLRLSAR